MHRMVFKLLLAWLMVVGSGCGLRMTMPLVGQEVLPPAKDNKAYVVVGMQLGDAGDIDCFNAALVVGGKLAAIKGVADARKYTKDEVPALTSEATLDGDILTIAREDKVYRVWQINRGQFKKNNGNSLFYICSVRKKTGTEVEYFGKHYISPLFKLSRSKYQSYPVPLSYPSYGMRPSSDTDIPWSFQAIAFAIEGSGVYYLGDYSIDGTLTSTGKKGMKLLNCSVNRSADADTAKTAPALTPLSHKPIIDVSDQWQSIDGEDWYRYLTGKL